MAYALALLQSFEVNATGPVLNLQIQFAGSGVPGGADQSVAVVQLIPGDTANTIRTKMANAVSAEATRLGYTLSPTDLILPSFQKG